MPSDDHKARGWHICYVPIQKHPMTVHKFMKQELELLAGHLQTCAASYDTEVLHQIRVELKKIKAVLRLLQKEKVGTGRKHTALFKEIFRLAGEIRESDLHLQWLSAQGFPAQTATISKKIAGFQENIPLFLQQLQKQQKKLIASTKKIHRKELKRFLHKRSKKIRRSLYPFVQPEQLHSLRKMMKEVVYLSPLLDRYKEKRQRFFKAMEEEIGTWHDKKKLRDYLESQQVGLHVEQRDQMEAERKQHIIRISHLAIDYYYE